MGRSRELLMVAALRNLRIEGGGLMGGIDGVN
jgi:hypothetical protein